MFATLFKDDRSHRPSLHSISEKMYIDQVLGSNEVDIKVGRQTAPTVALFQTILTV